MCSLYACAMINVAWAIANSRMDQEHRVRALHAREVTRMEDVLRHVSEALAATVEATSPGVVRVAARRRLAPGEERQEQQRNSESAQSTVDPVFDIVNAHC